MPGPRPAAPLAALALLGAAVGCNAPAPQQRTARAADATLDAPRLPTGARLDPVGRWTATGQMPLAMALAPEGDRVALLLSGWRDQGLQVVERASGRVLQTLPQRAAFLGLAFAPDGRALWTSGGDRDVVYRYAWANGAAALADSVILEPRTAKQHGVRYPAGLAFSADGRTLYVAENLGDSLAGVDVAARRVVQRLATGRYPYGVAVAGGAVWVSDWGASTLHAFTAAADGRLTSAGTVAVARHPSALAVGAAGARLFVASGSTDRITVVDTRRRRAIAELRDPAPGAAEGATPNALALSPDGTRLWVAEGDANAVAVFRLGRGSSGIAGASGDDRLAGRIPALWYPTALLAPGDSLLVASGKGRGTAPNPRGPQPTRGDSAAPGDFSLDQLTGALGTVSADEFAGAALDTLTARVTRANGWSTARTGRTPAARLGYPPIEHVIYVIKENRTYDQVLGDLPQGDGDPTLVFFPRSVTPNHHALAERFGIHDRFFVNAEVSADGHNWTTAAYATDYLQKTIPSQYGKRGRSYDYEGTNRGAFTTGDIPDDDVAEPASGYLWDLARRAGITYRDYGEFVAHDSVAPPLPVERRRWVATKPALRGHVSERYPGFDLDVSDEYRIRIWLEEFSRDVADGTLPALEVVRLPDDHTSALTAKRRTPRAYLASNDLALGRLVEAVSRSPVWARTVILVVEDDAQNGADHVDAHRAPFLLVSPWARPGVDHRWTNTTDVLATIEELLALPSLSPFDRYGRPLRDAWLDEPDLRPYAALVPAVPRDERNPAGGQGALDSRRLDLADADAADEDLFNAILWRAIKGAGTPMPPPRRASALEARRAR